MVQHAGRCLVACSGGSLEGKNADRNVDIGSLTFEVLQGNKDCGGNWVSCHLDYIVAKKWLPSFYPCPEYLREDRYTGSFGRGNFGRVFRLVLKTVV